MHLTSRIFPLRRRVGTALASMALGLAVVSLPAAIGQGTTATPQCPTFTGPWIQVNGAYTEEAQFVDAGEPINVPSGGLSFTGQKRIFASVVTTSGDLMYAIPSTFGTRLGRLSAAKQWQVWTDSGWSNSPNLVPRSIENTVLKYNGPIFFPHPTIQGGLLGVANAGVHSGGAVFDIHIFRAAFEFDGNKFTQWAGDASYDPFYAKQLIPARTEYPVDFAFDPATQTGIAVGSYGHDGASSGQLTAVRFSFTDTAQKWRRWHRTSASDPGHWLTDTDIQNGNSAWSTRIVNILDYDADLSNSEQRFARITRIPSASQRRYLVNFVQMPGAIGTAARYIDDGAQPSWEWWGADNAWHAVAAGAPFTYGTAMSGALVEPIAWHNGKVVMLCYDSDVGILEIIYDDTTVPPSFSSQHLIVPSTLIGSSNYSSQAPFVVGVDGDKKLWLVYTPDGIHIKARTRAIGQAWAPEIPIYDAPVESAPVGINFVSSSCIPIVFIERKLTLTYQAPARLFAISPNVAYWSGESALSASPLPDNNPPIDSPLLTFQNMVLNRASTGSGEATNFDIPGNIGIDANGYIYAPHISWAPTTIHPPGSTDPTQNFTWGSSYFNACAFPQAVAVDRVREKIYIANRPIGGSDEDMLQSPYNGKVSIWPQYLRNTNCEWGYCNPGICSPPPGFYDPRLSGFPNETIHGLGWPSDVAVDEKRGLLYVAEGMACMIHVYFIGGINPNVSPLYIYSFGSRGSANNQFMFVKGIDVDSSGNVFAVDCGNHRIQKWFYNAITSRVDGTPPYIWGTPGRGPGQFINPVGLDVDESLNRVYVTDPVNRRIQVFNTNGEFQFQFSKYWDRTVVPNVVRSLSKSIGIGSDDNGTLFIGIDDYIARFTSMPD